jgi:hypothetical protein
MNFKRIVLEGESVPDFILGSRELSVSFSGSIEIVNVNQQMHTFVNVDSLPEDLQDKVISYLRELSSK